MSKSNAKQTVAATLGTITTAATVVSNIFDTIGDGVGMLNRAVGTASEKQALNADYEMALFEDQLHEQISMQQAINRGEIERFFDADPRNRANYEQAYDSLAAAVQARRDKRAGVSNRPTQAPAFAA